MDISIDDFNSTIQSGITVVDFWAPWCGPCKALTPVIDDLEEAYEGRVTIAKVNVDEEPELTQKFGIRGVPSILLFRDGNLVGNVQAQKGKIVQAIEEQLAN